MFYGEHILVHIQKFRDGVLFCFVFLAHFQENDGRPFRTHFASELTDSNFPRLLSSVLEAVDFRAASATSASAKT